MAPYATTVRQSLSSKDDLLLTDPRGFDDFLSSDLLQE
jgi:hypothetical protein